MPKPERGKQERGKEGRAVQDLQLDRAASSASTEAQSFLVKVQQTYNVVLKMKEGPSSQRNRDIVPRVLKSLNDEVRRNPEPNDRRQVLLALLGWHLDLLEGMDTFGHVPLSCKLEVSQAISRCWQLSRPTASNKPYSMALIDLYCDCVGELEKGHAAALAFLHGWMEGPLASINAEDWMDPAEEQITLASNAVSELPTSSKKDRLLFRYKEIATKHERFKKLMSRSSCFDKGQIISHDLFHIVETKLKDEAKSEGPKHLAISKQEDQAQKFQQKKDSVAEFLRTKLQHLPLGSPARINALLAMSECSEAKLKAFLEEVMKPAPQEKEKGKGKAKPSEKEDILVERLYQRQLRLWLRSCEKGSWLSWSAVPPSQIAFVSNEEEDDQQQQQQQQQLHLDLERGVGARAGKGDNKTTKSGKNGGSGGSKGASGKSNDPSRPGLADGDDLGEELPPQLDSLSDWLKLLDKDLEGKVYSARLHLPEDVPGLEYPSIFQLWTGDVDLASSLHGTEHHGGHEESAADDATGATEEANPSSILDHYQQSYQGAGKILFSGTLLHLSQQGPDIVPDEHLTEPGLQGLDQSIKWLHLQDVIWGLDCLLSTRGLSPPHSIAGVQCPFIFILQALESQQSLAEFWEHDDHQDTVRVVNGEALPEGIFAHQDAAALPEELRRALADAAEARQCEAACCAASPSASGQPTPETKEGSEPDALHLQQEASDPPAERDAQLEAQLRLDVLDSVKILEGARVLTPLLQETLRGFLAACRKMTDRDPSALSENVLQAKDSLLRELRSMPLSELKSLRTFLLHKLGSRKCCLLSQLEIRSKALADHAVARGPDLHVSSSGNGALTLRLSPQLLSHAVHSADLAIYHVEMADALEQFYQECADGLVCPLIRVPARKQPTQLGTPEAEQALLDYLWDSEPPATEEGFTFQYLQTFLELAAYFNSNRILLSHLLQKVETAHDEADHAHAQMLQMQTEDPDELDDSCTSAARALHEAITKLCVSLNTLSCRQAKVIFEFYQEQIREWDDKLEIKVNQLKTKQGKLQKISEEIEKPKDSGQPSKRGAQAAGSEKRDPSLQQQQSKLRDEISELETCCLHFQSALTSAKTLAEPLERSLKGNGVAGMLGPCGSSSSSGTGIGSTTVDDLCKWYQGTRDIASQQVSDFHANIQMLAMLTERCLVTARMISAEMAFSSPYLDLSEWTDPLGFWRYILLDRRQEESGNDLIKDEEAAKAEKENKKKEAKKKEAFKSNKKAKALPVKIASDDDKDDEPDNDAPPLAEEKPLQEPQASAEDLHIFVDMGPTMAMETPHDDGPNGHLQQQRQQPCEDDQSMNDRKLQQLAMAQLNMTDKDLNDMDKLSELINLSSQMQQQAREKQNHHAREQQQQQVREQQQQQQRRGSDGNARGGANRDRSGRGQMPSAVVNEGDTQGSSGSGSGWGNADGSAQRKPREHVMARRGPDGRLEVAPLPRQAHVHSGIRPGAQPGMRSVPMAAPGDWEAEDDEAGRHRGNRKNRKKKGGRNEEPMQGGREGHAPEPGGPRYAVPGMWSDEDQQLEAGTGKVRQQQQQQQQQRSKHGLEGDAGNHKPRQQQQGSTRSSSVSAHPTMEYRSLSGQSEMTHEQEASMPSPYYVAELPSHQEEAEPPALPGEDDEDLSDTPPALPGDDEEDLSVAPPALPGGEDDESFEAHSQLLRKQDSASEWLQQQQHQHVLPQSAMAADFPPGGPFWSQAAAPPQQLTDPWRQQQQQQQQQQQPTDAWGQPQLWKQTADGWDTQHHLQHSHPADSWGQPLQLPQHADGWGQQPQQPTDSWARSNVHGLYPGPGQSQLPSIPDPNLAPYSIPFGFGGPPMPQPRIGGPALGAMDAGTGSPKHTDVSVFQQPFHAGAGDRPGFTQTMPPVSHQHLLPMQPRPMLNQPRSQPQSVQPIHASHPGPRPGSESALSRSLNAQPPSSAPATGALPQPPAHLTGPWAGSAHMVGSLLPPSPHMAGPLPPQPAHLAVPASVPTMLPPHLQALHGLPSRMPLQPQVIQPPLHPHFMQLPSPQQQQQQASPPTHMPSLMPPPLPAPSFQPHPEPDNDEDEDEDDGLGDLMSLCGVPAPAPASVALPVPCSLPEHSPPLAVPVQAAPPALVNGSAHHDPPHSSPSGHATPSQQAPQQQQQPGAPSSAPPVMRWGAKPAAAPRNSIVEPGPGGFPGVIDELEYPSLSGRPTASRGAALPARPRGWTQVVKSGDRDQDAAKAWETQAAQEEEDDEELQRVLQESRLMSSSLASAPGMGLHGAEERMPSTSSVTPALPVAATGLVNRQGEYNCFLNVIIQCLWHCDEFRLMIEQHSPDLFRGHPVVHNLALLFRALTQAKQQWTSGAARSVVDPTQLREALDTMPHHNFRLGEMNDPSEVLTAIYECLTKVVQLRTAKNVPHVDNIFGLVLREQLQCQWCRHVSHVVKPHIEYFHIVQATALRVSAVCGGGSMSTMLKDLDSQNQKKCDKDIGGCDRPGTPLRHLVNRPHMFTLLMAWEEQVSGDEIRGTLDVVDTEVTLDDLYDSSASRGDRGSYRLHSMFCYYGQHYHAFIHKEEVQKWVMFDDAQVSSVGTWQDVIQKCTAGRIQPLVLFYKIVV